MFQSLYQPAPAHWAMLPGTLEWHGAAVLLAIAALVLWQPLAAVPAAMIALSLAVAILAGSAGRTSRAAIGACGRAC